MITVSVVDDEKELCQTIATFINNTPGFRCVSTYQNAEAALEHLPRDRPDVVLMDIRLTGMSGIECVKHLKSMVSDMQIMMWTVHEDIEQIFQALSAGASGYMLKPSALDKLLNAIREVHNGGSPMSSPIARKVVSALQQTRKHDEAKTHLAQREQMVLECFVQGLTYAQTANHLNISIDTLRTYVRRIYEKFHVHCQTEAVAKYMRHRRTKPS